MTPKAQKIIYITRDIERALGMEPNSYYHIVSNRTEYGENIKQKYPNFVTLIESLKGDLLGTFELLSEPEAKKLATKSADQDSPLVLVFKNTSRIEGMAKTNHWNLLNPSAFLSEKIENKVSQITWLGPLAQKFLPRHGVSMAKNIRWNNEPFILQWAHGHTGGGTMLITNEDELRQYREYFPFRLARLSEYLQGPSFTLNAVVTPKNILLGNISYQITGLKPFTDSPYSTIGNDWALPNKILSSEEISQIRSMVNEIGTKMQAEGWKGLFGVDVMKDNKTNRIYLIEINARQPASTTFESIMQNNRRQDGELGLTTFEAHIQALLGEDLENASIVSIDNGAQIIQRVTKGRQDIPEKVISSVNNIGLQTISYKNNKLNADLIRIQCDSGIMADHDIFNEKGEQIEKLLV